MPLTIRSEWLFSSPENGTYINKEIPPQIVNRFYELIMKISSQGNRKTIIEEYKSRFCSSMGNACSSSSSVSWAESDLSDAMLNAAMNAPLFIKTYFDTSELFQISLKLTLPDISLVNSILRDGNLGYQIIRNNLVQRDNSTLIISSTEEVINIDEKNYDLLIQSFQRSDKLLNDGHGREAVQESLWLLETISTGFLDTDSENERSEAKYFNQIIRELKKKKNDTVFKNVSTWLLALHGFLSSPTGGGIRHGMNLNLGNYLSIDEARLYLNLIRSYTYYIYSEYKKEKNNFA